MTDRVSFPRFRRSNFKSRWFAFLCGSLLLTAALSATEPVLAKKDWSQSPLPPEMYRVVSRAQSQMKSGKFKQATATINDLLASANDVPKCLAIAAATESYGFPMMDARRACMNRAFQLSGSNDDMILVALKSRQYQFFEITRQAIHSLLASAKTVNELYDLARRCQEVALNDVAHLAMEKAYTGIKDQPSAFAFAEQSKALGMEDLLRKVVKDLIDDQDEVATLCDILCKTDGYKLRDQTRYGLRKALDKSATVPDMEAIFETARRLNEPDIANRANYFIRRGKVIQKIKEDRQGYDAQLKSWREGIDIDTARQQMGIPESSSGSTTGSAGTQRRPNEPPTSGF